MSYDTSGYRAYDSLFGTIIYSPNYLLDMTSGTRPLTEYEAKPIRDAMAALLTPRHDDASMGEVKNHPSTCAHEWINDCDKREAHCPLCGTHQRMEMYQPPQPAGKVESGMHPIAPEKSPRQIVPNRTESEIKISIFPDSRIAAPSSKRCSTCGEIHFDAGERCEACAESDTCEHTWAWSANEQWTCSRCKETHQDNAPTPPWEQPGALE